MIRLRNLRLDPAAAQRLRSWQAAIDGIPSYAQRVQRAKSRWQGRNRTVNPTFRCVRQTLARMCSGATRCAYCEDSCADEVEHIRPKDLYPEAVFVWSNYVYACGPCNGPKNNRFAILNGSGTGVIDLTRRRGEPVVPPLPGDPALLDPRREDPAASLELDLLDTFWVLPRPGIPPRARVRAEYTIDILRLNERDALPEARREAYGSYRARLREYVDRRVAGEPEASLRPLVAALRSMQHPFVWTEMRRQQIHVPELARLFARAPEAFKW